MAGRIRCPECGSNVIEDYETHEEVCVSCGYVLHTAPMYSGPVLERDKRTGKRKAYILPSSYTVPDKNLHTVIIPRKNSSQNIYRLRRLQYFFILKNRPFFQALDFISMLSDQLRVSKEEQENISYLFRKVTRNLRGKSYKLIAAGCVWYYVKRRRLEREVEDMICNLTGFEKPELRRAYRFVREKVGVSFSDELKKNVYLILDKIYPDFTPKSKKIKATADQILKVVKENRMHQGRSPSIIATAIDYMAIKLNSGNTSQTGLADLAHITEVSLRNNYKRLMQMLYIEIAF